MKRKSLFILVEFIPKIPFTSISRPRHNDTLNVNLCHAVKPIVYISCSCLIVNLLFMMNHAIITAK